MSDGYWRGSLSTDDAAPAGAAMRSDAAVPVDGLAGAPPVEPAQSRTRQAMPDGARSGVAATGSYWQGRYGHEGDVGEAFAERLSYGANQNGAVSARARQAYAAEALRQKDHVAAGLLAIFLGLFGVHKFYLGCNQAGFLMLAVTVIGSIFTLGLAAAVIEVIAIVEGVIYLTKSQTEFDQVYVLNQRDWF